MQFLSPLFYLACRHLRVLLKLPISVYRLRDLSELSEERTEQDKAINMLRDDSERTLATILITNNFVNVTIIMLCNYIFTSLVYFGEKAYWLQFLIVTVLLTFLLLLFGEIIPKVYSREDP